MNNKKNYSKGVRKAIMDITLANGFMPYKAISLLGFKKRTTQDKIREIQEEGLITKYNKKGMWMIGIDDIDKIRKELEPYYPQNDLDKMLTQGYTDYKICKHNIDAYPQRLFNNCYIFTMMYGCGVHCMMGDKPNIEDTPLSNELIYYTSREIKSWDGYTDDIVGTSKKLSNSRISGMMLSGENAYGIYYMSKELPTYELSGETKMRIYIERILLKQNSVNFTSAILITNEIKTFSKYVTPVSIKSAKQCQNISDVYQHIYAITCDDTGQQMLSLMKNPKWKSKIYNSILSKTQRANKDTYVDCDGKDGDTYIFVFCVPDIKRYRMFLLKAKAEKDRSKYTIICFDNQQELINETATGYARIFTVSFDEYRRQL